MVKENRKTAIATKDGPKAGSASSMAIWTHAGPSSTPGTCSARRLSPSGPSTLKLFVARIIRPVMVQTNRVST